MGEETKVDKTFALWKGADRTKIDWYPTVDEQKCVGCGMCVTTCGKNVYDYDWKRKKAVVARSIQCLVGCTSCMSWCLFGAINFPEVKIVRDFITKEKILAKAKQEITEKYGPKNADS